MLFIGIDVEVNGPYTEQPLLVKIGIWMMFAVTVIFLGFVPTSAVVAACFGVGGGGAAPDWKGIVAISAIMGGMAAIGAWADGVFLAEFRGAVLKTRNHFRFTGCKILASAIVASIAAFLGVWPEVLLTAFGLILLCFLLAIVLTKVGQVVESWRTSLRASDIDLPDSRR